MLGVHHEFRCGLCGAQFTFTRNVLTCVIILASNSITNFTTRLRVDRQHDISSDLFGAPLTIEEGVPGLVRRFKSDRPNGAVRLQDQVKQKKPRSSEPGLLSFRVWSVADDRFHGRFATSRSCFAQGYLDPNATYPSDNCIPLWTRNDAYLQQLK